MSNGSKQDLSKLSGQYHSMKGSIVESLGDTMGNKAWSQSGKEEHARGEGEYKAAQGKDYVEGATDRVSGYKDSIIGAVSGDKSQQAAGNAKNEKGRAQQEVNKPTID